jgi:AraC-like DNA-binding protein
MASMCNFELSEQRPSPTRPLTLLDVATLRSMSSASAYDPDVLASRLGVSQRHLRRLFVTQFGCSLARWLREERLQTALGLLRSAASVKEVGYALAFANMSQFCRDFRVRFGCTPSELRKQQRAVADEFS